MEPSRKTDDRTESEQTALWKGAAGRAWVDAQATLDEMFRLFEELLVDAVTAKARASVLDVGCGTGSTTLAVKRRAGAGCRCVGIDVSGPMLERARLRAEQEGVSVSFIEADAERYAFEGESFDAVMSRFGVMFFEDPVRAFANLRRAARDGADLHVVAWRSANENPFMTTAERAAGHILPSVPARDPDAPGQFAFASSERVRRILDASGWADIEIRAVDVDCTFPEDALTQYVTRFGPVGRVLREADEPTKARVLAVVRPAFERYVHDGTVCFSAACWMVSARARAADQ